jgi:hypothetical protein
MAKFFWDVNKYGDSERTPTTKAFHSALRALVQERLAREGIDWNGFVFAKSYELITAKDIEKIESDLLATGYRYEVSAGVSAKEAPEKYKPLQGQILRETVGEAQDGKLCVGYGDNVMSFPANVFGIARYVRTTEDVMEMMENGVPADTIGVVDDAGGTLTAPILAEFKAVVCLGGTVRSHFGILSREYGIPCLMNSKISGIKSGDRLELNVTAPAKTALDYQKGIEKKTEIWRLV